MTIASGGVLPKIHPELLSGKQKAAAASAGLLGGRKITPAIASKKVKNYCRLVVMIE